MNGDTDPLSLAIETTAELDRMLGSGFGRLNEMLVSQLGSSALVSGAAHELQVVQNRRMISDIVDQFPSSEATGRVLFPTFSTIRELKVSDVRSVPLVRGHLIGVTSSIYSSPDNYYIIGRNRSKKTTDLLLHRAPINDKERHNNDLITLEVGNKTAQNLDAYLRSTMSQLLDYDTLNGITGKSNDFSIAPTVTALTGEKMSKRHGFNEKNTRFNALLKKDHNIVPNLMLAEFQVFGYLGQLASGLGVADRVIEVIQRYKDTSPDLQSGITDS